MATPFFCDWDSLRGKSMPQLTPTQVITINSVDGSGILAACYLPAGASVGCTTLRPSIVKLKIPTGVIPSHVTLYSVRGLITGDWMLITDYSGPNGTEVTLAQAQVRVAAYEKAQGMDSISSVPGLSYIMLDSYGLSQRVGYFPSVLSWKDQVNQVLKNIYSNPLGKALLTAIGQKYPQRPSRVGMLHREAPHLPHHVDPTDKLMIRPYLGYDINADSGISFSPDMHNGDLPGSSPEEILFHELVHISDGEFGGYLDGENLTFDGADFFSVNATNVYSSSLNRSLRKDHGGFNFMPVKFASDPAAFAKAFRGNIHRAAVHAPAFHRALAHFDRHGLWNPFLPHLPDFVPVT